jgi:NADPH-dependent 2,4-dienoyl-CoA reductase/sulfur reductase-like enzyme
MYIYNGERGFRIMSKRLLIIGGVAAGMSAAAKARRINPQLEITVYTQEEYISYAGCGLPYFIGDKISDKKSLIARTIEDFATQNIIVNTRTKVEKIRDKSKILILKDLVDNNMYEDYYDKLIIATGARPFIPPMEGIELEGIFTLRTINDSLAIKDYLKKRKSGKATIIGGGYIGLEMAENLYDKGWKVSIIEKAPHIIPNMDEDMASIVTEYLEDKGIKVYTGITVKGFSGNGVVNKVITDKEDINTDFVLLSIGVIPNSEITKDTDIELGPRNAILVNNKMETNVKDIYAAGDCATTTHLITGEDVYIPLGTTANKQGKTAGENVAGGESFFKGVLGTGIARVLEMEMSRTGLSENECKRLGIDYVAKQIKSRSAAHYCPDSGSAYVKLIANKQNNRLIGAQILGYKGAAMRIGMLATAITMKATIEDLIDMDLAYSPPFSPVWDPVLIALNQF